MTTLDRPLAAAPTPDAGEVRDDRPRVRVGPRHVALLALAVPAAVLMTWRLGVGSAAGDEVAYRGAALDMLAGEWLTNAQHPPLVKELMALAHLALGDTVAADRLPGALAAWATGLLVAALVWRVGGPGRVTGVTGVAAAALWWVLPYGPARTALLEGPMAFFVLAAQLVFVLALLRRAPRWLLVGGALVGLAAACKLTGAAALAGALPAAWLLWRDGQRGGPGGPLLLGHLVAATLLAGSTYLLTFAPMGTDALDALARPVTFQLGHAADGHPVIVAGEVRADPPWWAPFAFQAGRLGTAACAGLWAAALVGAVRHRRALAPVWVTLAVLVVALTTSPLALGHYHYVWWPCLVVLAASALVPSRGHRAAATAGPRGRRVDVAACAALLALAPVVAAGVRHVDRVRHAEPSGYDKAAAVLDARVGPDVPTVVWADVGSVRSAMPGRRLTASLPADLDPAALVYVESWAVRKDGTDLATWERCRSADYTRHDLGSVLLFVREDQEAGEQTQQGARADDPACDTLRRRR